MRLERGTTVLQAQFDQPRRFRHAHVHDLVRAAPVNLHAPVVPSDYHAVRDSVDYGKPLAKRNPVRTAIAELAARIVGQPAETSKKSWLSGIAHSR